VKAIKLNKNIVLSNVMTLPIIIGIKKKDKIIKRNITIKILREIKRKKRTGLKNGIKKTKKDKKKM